MGEYVEFNGEQYKIGTCSDMYYIRYDEMLKIKHLINTDGRLLEKEYLRDKTHFRFPFPDEDSTASDEQTILQAVGIREPFRKIDFDFQDMKDIVLHKPFFKSFSVKGICNVNVKMPCPLSKEFQAFNFETSKGGFAHAPVTISMQTLINGKIKTVFSCGYCECKYTADDDEIEKIKTVLREQYVHTHSDEKAQYYATVIERIS